MNHCEFLRATALGKRVQKMDRKNKPSIEHRLQAPAQGPSTSSFTTLLSYGQNAHLSTDKTVPASDSKPAKPQTAKPEYVTFGSHI